MIPNVHTSTIDLGDGRTITLETGKLAKQADGSVVIRSGNCMLLATVVSARQASPVDFLPLTVDYREKFAAAGRFPGGFFKREARPSDIEKSGLLSPKKLSVFFPVKGFVLHAVAIARRKKSVSSNLEGFI